MELYLLSWQISLSSSITQFFWCQIDLDDIAGMEKEETSPDPKLCLTLFVSLNFIPVGIVALNSLSIIYDP